MKMRTPRLQSINMTKFSPKLTLLSPRFFNMARHHACPWWHTYATSTYQKKGLITADKRLEGLSPMKPYSPCDDSKCKSGSPFPPFSLASRIECPSTFFSPIMPPEMQRRNEFSKLPSFGFLIPLLIIEQNYRPTWELESGLNGWGLGIFSGSLGCSLYGSWIGSFHGRIKGAWCGNSGRPVKSVPYSSSSCLRLCRIWAGLTLLSRPIQHFSVSRLPCFASTRPPRYDTFFSFGGYRIQANVA